MLTVTVPAPSRRLATTAAVRAVLPDIDDAGANALLDVASAAIETATNRVFAAETVAETWRLEDTVVHLIPERQPVRSIASVVEDGAVLPPADYETDGQFVYRLTSDVRGTWRARKVVVTYTAGFSEIPPDVSRACVMACVALHASRARDTAIRSMSVPDVMTVSYLDPANGGGALPGAVRELIDPYRRIAW